MLVEPMQRRPEAAWPGDRGHPGQAGRSLDEVIELLSGPGHPEDHGAQLAQAVASALGAPYCVITFLADGQAGGRHRSYANATPPAAAASSAPGDATVLAEMRCDGEVIGSVQARRAAGQCSFTDGDRELAKVVACFLGRSLQVVHLRNLLRSRFARIALSEGERATDIDGLLQQAVFPERMVRLLARSFYREMRKAGLGQAQIIAAVSEIISQLTQMLKAPAQAEPSRPLPDGP